MTTEALAGELWWKNAVVYCLDVETFMDSDGDGVGDFKGLARQVDYLASLGVTCLWLLPFYPGRRDDGYAVTDFLSVDPRFGTLGDFVTFRRTAADRGIRVVIDLVGNHTSDEHPWFAASRSSRDHPKRDWYVWADEPIPEAGQEVYPGQQDGNWAHDAATDQWYFHRFFPFQPDLNWAHPEVREQFLQIMGFWLELGVSGFRLDAAPFIINATPPHGAPDEQHHEWLREVHEFVNHRRGDTVLIGEANIEPDRITDFFGTGDEMQLLFNYSQNSALVAALAERTAEPLRRHLTKLPEAPRSCGWLNFVRLHDELSLERLDDAERARVFERLAPEPEHQIYERGIRRRMAPLLRDRRQLELAYSLAFSTPGVPLLLYGDEIGMGDDLGLEGRLSVRTPMQWNATPSAGFSEAPPDRLVRPLVTEPDFAPARVNVRDQRRDRTSLLAWMRQLLDVRRQHPAIGQGGSQLLDVGHEDVFAHRCEWQLDVLVALHNLAGEARRVDLRDLVGDVEVTVVLADDRSAGAEDGHIELPPFGYRWLVYTRGREDRSLP